MPYWVKVIKLDKREYPERVKLKKKNFQEAIFLADEDSKNKERKIRKKLR